jgi:Mor family transcriptional regulator
MKTSLHSQASSVDIASAWPRRLTTSNAVRLKQSEAEMIEAGLKAAARTLMLLQSWRGRAPDEMFAEIEGGQ